MQLAEAVAEIVRAEQELDDAMLEAIRANQRVTEAAAALEEARACARVLLREQGAPV